MGQFEKIAEELINTSEKVIELIKTKNEYAKSVNYQINQLFLQLGQSRQQDEALLIDTDHLRRDLTTNQLNILFNKDNRQNSYLTPEDLCAFLHISKHNLKRNNAIIPLDKAFVDQFFALLENQERIEDDLINILSQVDLQAWFSQVDFFNNGYIDTSALYEYFVHYDSKHQVYQEYNALIILKIIKRHSLTDKLVLEDFKNFIQKSREIQIFLTNEQLSPVQSIKVEAREIDKHIKQKSNELYSLQSEVSIMPEIKIGPKLVDHLSYNNNFESLGLISRQQIEEQLKQQENITFEERLIRLHSRNQKYIKQAKRQMEGIIPICNIQIQSHMQVQAFKSNSTQLIRQFRLLGDIYNKTIKLIQTFLSKNVKFTFVNAFALLDVNETNSVDFNRLKQFITQLEINLSIKKLSIFFNSYSSKGLMNYSQFLKIFKYASAQEDYVRCSTRYPLIYENWSDELVYSYKTFFAKIVKLVQEKQAIIDNIEKQEKQLTILLKSFSFVDEITEILGQEYKQFVRQNFYQSNQRLFCNLIPNADKTI